MDEKPQTEKPNEKKKIVGLLMLEAGTEFAFLIAVPLIAGILIGKWADNKYHHHFFVIIGLLAGIFITGFSIYRRILDYKKMLK